MADNPFAFPLAMIPESVDNPGMTLRDWFAGQIAGAVFSASIGKTDHLEEMVAFGAYRVADAMLAERAK